MKTTAKLIAVGGLLAMSAACAVNPPPPGAAGGGYYNNDREPARYADRNYPNDRYGNDRYGNDRPGYGDVGYDRQPVGPDPFYQENLSRERIWDESSRRWYYIDPQTTYSYWHNGEFRSR